MRSLALITSYAPSLANFRAPLIRTLHAKGIKVLALAPDFDERTRDAVLALGASPIDCPMERSGMNPVRDVLNTLRMARLLRKLQPDITLGYFIKPVIFGAIAARWAGVARRISMVEGLGFVFTASHEALPLKRRLLKRLVLTLYKLGMACAHKVIFLNPDDRDELLAARALPLQKTFVLGGIGVDLNLWPPTPPVLEPMTFLLVARLLREKGIEQFAQAARSVKQQHPHTRFILLGGLDENPGAISEADVRAWVTEGILEWHGHVPVQPWMAQASVYVLPSFREGVPVSTQEAMASGRAVITTNAPGCRETVVDGENGFLIPVQNVKALVQAMLRFVDDPDLAVHMGQRSRALAEENFDVHKVNAIILREIGI